MFTTPFIVVRSYSGFIAFRFHSSHGRITWPSLVLAAAAASSAVR